MIQLSLFPPMPYQGRAPAYWPYDFPRAYPGKQLIRELSGKVVSVPCMFDLATNYIIPEKIDPRDLEWGL